MRLLRKLFSLLRRSDSWAAARESDHAAASYYLNGWRDERR